MKRDRGRLLWPLAAFAAALALLCACFLDDSLWRWFGVDPLRPYFADLFAILAASDARAAGADPYASPNFYDPFGRPHIYGPWWLELGRLGLGRADCRWMGMVLLVGSLTAMAAWLRPRGPVLAMAALGLMVSPSALLGLERGNNDMVVLLLLMAAGVLLARRATAGRVFAAGGVVFAAAALKFYPLAAAPFLMERRPARRAFWVAAGVGVAFAIFYWLNRAELARAISMVPSVDTVRGYGLKVALSLWGNRAASREFAVAGFLAGAAGWLWLAMRERRHPIPLGWRAAGFAAGAWAWVLCYLAGFSCVYRAVLLILPAGAWLHAAAAAGKPARVSARVALSGLLLMLWITAFHGRMMGSLTLAERKAASFVLGLQTGLAAGLTGYLGYVLFRRGWRALKRARAGR